MQWTFLLPLKIRTGWAPEHRNCEEIAQLAEDCGIEALTILAVTRLFVQWRSWSARQQYPGS